MNYFEMQNTIQIWINDLQDEVYELDIQLQGLSHGRESDYTAESLMRQKSDRQELIDMLDDVQSYSMGMSQE